MKGDLNRRDFGRFTLAGLAGFAALIVSGCGGQTTGHDTSRPNPTGPTKDDSRDGSGSR